MGVRYRTRHHHTFKDTKSVLITQKRPFSMGDYVCFLGPWLHCAKRHTRNPYRYPF